MTCVTNSITESFKDITYTMDCNKFYCESCDITLARTSKAKHLKSESHLAGVKKAEEKLTCPCGGKYYSALFHLHCRLKKHRDYVDKQECENKKRENYELSKDTKICCEICLKIDVPSKDYNSNLKICKTCEKISSDIDRTCNTCNETKRISLFEKPRLTRCKKCAAEIWNKNQFRKKA
jgi:hypothetical protein